MRKPVVQALVLADHIYVDAATGKKVIAGAFHALWAGKFPTKLARTTWAYICLTEVRGSVSVSLKYTDLQTNQVLLSTSAVDIKSDNPLASHEMIVEVPPFPMPHAGTYVFEVFSGGESLGSLRLTVAELKE